MYLSQNSTDCMLNRNYIHHKGNEQPQGPNTVVFCCCIAEKYCCVHLGVFCIELNNIFMSEYM